MALDLNIDLPSERRRGDVRKGPTPPGKTGTPPVGLLSHRTIAAMALLAHLTCLWLIGDVYGGGLALAQTFAAIAASVTLYGIRTMLSYRRRGPWRWYLGLLPFLASCSFGILGSVMLASWLAGLGMDWFAAGLCGALIGLWWNEGAVSRHGWSAQ